jgi:MerR family transcriptional regulator/heat shock protein HspR
VKVLEKKYYIQIYRHTLPTAEDSEWVELESLEIHPDIVQQLVEWGIVEIRGSHVHFRQAVRLQKLMRLRRKLGVNLPGAAIIVDLLERIETLQDEIDRLKKR